MPDRYEAFEVHVGVRTASGYPVRVQFRGSNYSNEIPVELPLLQMNELQQALVWLDHGFVDSDYAEDLGSRLFQTLFAGKILVAFREAYATVAPEAGLRIVLSLPQELLNVPWELMFDAHGEHGFLARSKTAPLVRHFDELPIPNSGPKRGPLRVLVVTASPSDLPPISQTLEANTIRSILLGRIFLSAQTIRLLRQRLRMVDFDTPSVFFRHRITVDVLENATRTTLQRKLDTAEAYHVVHFAGHGVTENDEAYLLLERDPTQSGTAEATTATDLVSASDFAEIIANPALSLVFINACQSARPLSLFNCAAHALMLRRTPAVISMQTQVLDMAAVQFAREFYYAWTAGDEIESALASARRLMLRENAGAVSDWSIPVLHLGPRAGLSLSMESSNISLPWPIRAAQLLLLSLLGLVTILGTLMGIPALSRQVRTEVPYINCIYPYPMNESSFNVVIVPFTYQGQNGSVEAFQEGENVASDFYASLDNLKQELQLPAPLELRPPQHTCATLGNTPEARMANARKLAKQINANLVIFGVITGMGVARELQPEFYIDSGRFISTEVPSGAYEGFNGGSLQIPISRNKAQQYLNCVLAAPMDASKFNVVMAPYTQEVRYNHYVPSEDGRLLASELYGRFDRLFKELDLDVDYVLRAPTSACPITGDTPEDRDKNARNYADRINANVVIYGLIQGVAPGDKGRAQLETKFHISYKGFSEAPELAGPYGIGNPESIDLPINSEEFQGSLEHPLHRRVRALSMITIGLADYVLDDFSAALRYFKAAKAAMNRRSGQEIAYLLLGNAYTRQASKEMNSSYVSLALDNFDAALAIKPDFARAQVGKASALYQQSLGNMAEMRLNQVNLERLASAEEAFNKARMITAPESAHVSVKADFGLGQIYLVRHYVYDSPGANYWLERASESFENVVKAKENGVEGVDDLAGHAHARLGLISSLVGKTEQEISEYSKAVDLVSPHWKIQYSIQIGDVYSATGQTQLARKYYESALALSDKYNEAASLVTAETKIEGLH